MIQQFIIRKGDAPVLANAVEAVRGLDTAKAWRIEIKPYRKARSLAQNRLNWMYCNLVADAVHEHTGMDADEVHAFFKAKFCPPKAIEMAGQFVESRSTTRLNTAEMTEYLDAMYRFCVQEIGLILPTPGLFEECGGDIGIIRERLSA